MPVCIQASPDPLCGHGQLTFPPCAADPHLENAIIIRQFPSAVVRINYTCKGLRHVVALDKYFLVLLVCVYAVCMRFKNFCKMFVHSVHMYRQPAM